MTDQTQDKQVTGTSGWKKPNGRVVELPSGNVARVRTPGLPAFLKMGFIPDNLVNIVKKAVEEKTADEEQIVGEMLENPEKLEELFELYDRVAKFVFIEPSLEFPVYPEDHEHAGQPLKEEDRSDEVVYTDEVEFEDKAFVFNFAVGGTADLTTFRQEQGALVERVSDGEAVGSSAE